ncbi:unnamed protein product [Gordionus sp. m RMFG-2023]
MEGSKFRIQRNRLKFHTNNFMRQVSEESRTIFFMGSGAKDHYSTSEAEVTLREIKKIEDMLLANPEEEKLGIKSISHPKLKGEML